MAQASPGSPLKLSSLNKQPFGFDGGQVMSIIGASSLATTKEFLELLEDKITKRYLNISIYSN